MDMLTQPLRLNSRELRELESLLANRYHQGHPLLVKVTQARAALDDRERFHPYPPSPKRPEGWRVPPAAQSALQGAVD